MNSTELPVIGNPPKARAARFVGTAETVSFGKGFYDEEHDGSEPFRWMARAGVLTFSPRRIARFLELNVRSEFHDLTQRLTARAGEAEDELDLAHAWTPISIAIPPGACEIKLAVSEIFPKAYYPGDTRELGICVRAPTIHENGERHDAIRRQWKNKIHNTREMLARKTVLASTPPELGIDLHGACNVKPPCVYCEWDDSKEKEGDNVDTPFTVDTLADYGEFFANSGRLQNCSVGEPFMKRDLDDLLDVFGNAGKSLEMSTNGQILTDRNIQKLLGRNVQLFISLDAATSETYARLRNDTLPRILDNVRRLVDAKGGREGLPKVFLVFMPMRANVHELEDFVKLCAELRVDRLVLRPLNATLGNNLAWDRAGYHFDYDREILPFDELVRVSGRAAELGRRHGVDVLDQLDFGGELALDFEREYAQGREEVTSDVTVETRSASELAADVESARTAPIAPATESTAKTAELPSLGSGRLPICQEPWTNLYILRRGVFPCSYGYKPVGPTEQFRESWNSTILQNIRAKLGDGELHHYCLQSKACPILRKFESAHKLPFRQRAALRTWHMWKRANAVTGGIPSWAFGRLKAAFGLRSRT
ncbi:MAG: hypothetical protein BMS9Abin37_0887 [Acidobacteriota bacterium]|nr:MAG: hypothetical protein BMS9Abin37_0887 [Acidobacteriota bacterium]